MNEYSLAKVQSLLQFSFGLEHEGAEGEPFRL